ncbi:MAG: flagellar brake protein [Lachnospiraceae bacterium]|nr:flagellar brake protein [Lachnospiraceae bacterium]
MLSKYVKAGSKLEIQKVDRVKYNNYNDNEKPPIYETTVYDIISEDRLEIAMPMVQSKIILLPVDSEYDLCLYTDNGLYQCFGRVIDRYKSRTIYLVLVELTSNLRKFQRREFYRFSCALEMNSRKLEADEVRSIESESFDLSPNLPLQRSIVVDISGGGLRFVSNYAYELGTLIHCCYSLTIDGKYKEYNLVGKVLNIQENPSRPGLFEHRVQYVDINTEEREEIIRFIFEEERKNRNKDRW